MPSHSAKQAKVMSAIAHGWHPDKGSVAKIPVKVAREFHAADGKMNHKYGKGRPGEHGPDPVSRSVAAADVALVHTVAGKQMDNWLRHEPKASHGKDRAPPKMGAYPAPAAGAHGYGHAPDHRSGHLRMSGHSGAHRIGKK